MLKPLKDDNPEHFNDVRDLEPAVENFITIGSYEIGSIASKYYVFLFIEDFNNLFPSFCNLSTTKEEHVKSSIHW